MMTESKAKPKAKATSRKQATQVSHQASPAEGRHQGRAPCK